MGIPQASIAHSKINVCPLCLSAFLYHPKQMEFGHAQGRPCHTGQTTARCDSENMRLIFLFCFFLLSGPLYDGAGDSMLSVYPQPPRYQPSDYGITVPSAQLQGNPLPMVSQEDSPFPTWEPWNPSYPLSVPHLLPGFVPGDPSLQEPWSTCDNL